MNLREKHERMGLMMTIALLETQFDILALAFGRHNAAAAEAALVVIEDETARQLRNLHEERIVDGHKAEEAMICARVRDDPLGAPERGGCIGTSLSLKRLTWQLDIIDV